MIATLEDILVDFDPTRFEIILNKEILFEGKSLIISKLLGNGADKIVFALVNKEGSNPTHVLKILRRKMSELEFEEWKAIDTKLKSAILQFNETMDCKVDEYRVEFHFPSSYFFLINGWVVEIQEYVGGAYLDEIKNNSKRFDFFQAIKSKDLSSILAEADKLLEQHPLIPDILQVKGQCLIALNNIDEGIDCLEQALEADPGLQFIYSMLASANLLRGNLSQAKVLARQAIGNNPNDIDAYVTLFDVEIKTGNIKNAARTFACLEEMNFPKQLLPMMRQQLELVIEERNEIAGRLQRAFSSEEGNNSKDIAEVLSNTRERYPTHVFPWYFSGIIALSANDLENAKRYFAEAYRLDSFDPENIFQLGFINLISFCPHEAKRYLKEWIDLVYRLFITIQEKTKSPQNNILSVTLEEGAFLESINGIKKDCVSVLSHYYIELSDEDKKCLVELEDVMKEIGNFYNAIKDFNISMS